MATSHPGLPASISILVKDSAALGSTTSVISTKRVQWREQIADATPQINSANRRNLGLFQPRKIVKNSIQIWN
jgi:hypothetical protein